MHFEDFGLGMRPAPDTKHLDLYPIRQMMPTTVEHVEDTLPLPYRYRVGYNQGREGACVGFASSWMMSILNRRYYNAHWLYKEAQKIDEWVGEAYSGTSVRAGMDVLRTVGHRQVLKNRPDLPPDRKHGILENRWAKSVDEVRTCIAKGTPVVLGVDWMSNFDRPVQKGREFWIGEGNLGNVRGGHAIVLYGASDRRQAVKLCNSWGKVYPLVYMPYTTLQRLLDGIQWPGEATVVTDMP